MVNNLIKNLIMYNIGYEISINIFMVDYNLDYQDAVYLLSQRLFDLEGFGIND